ncbi:MAG TPA: sporulation-delaying protein SdpB family protein [Myxococcaceae bacterium]|nr:sporulation-delaying protein SdpB family protein [Myxococcaceae bacterium]
MLTRTDRPWTNVYGLARSMLATATLLTLLADSSERLFQPLVVDDPGIIDRSAIAGASLFFLARNHLVAAKLLAVAVLLLVIVGWRPRFTALPHWWISYSFAASASMIDGGDQIAATLCLLLLPVALTDDRSWHWTGTGAGGPAASIAAQTGWVLIRVQMAIVYLFAAVLKFPSEEWANGTALYYWWRNPAFGAAGLLRPVTDWIGRTVLVVPLTWSALLLELCLAAALVAPLRFRSTLLPVAVLFHLGIALTHGLVTFAVTMSAALILYLRPAWRPFAFPELLRRPAARSPEPVARVTVAP